jgi:hypothetical protein
MQYRPLFDGSDAEGTDFRRVQFVPVPHGTVVLPEWWVTQGAARIHRWPECVIGRMLMDAVERSRFFALTAAS